MISMVPKKKKLQINNSKNSQYLKNYSNLIFIHQRFRPFNFLPDLELEFARPRSRFQEKNQIPNRMITLFLFYL